MKAIHLFIYFLKIYMHNISILIKKINSCYNLFCIIHILHHH
nr:MAG TPA: hypothetical protein [Caudoviricetes sp.]